MPRRKDNPKPWERQRGERTRAFAAFEHYLLAGSVRSIRKTARELGRSQSQISNWAKRKRWAERVYAWDDMMAEQRRLEAEGEIRKRLQFHTSLADYILKRAKEALDKIEGKRFSLNAIANAVKIAAEIQRVSLGMPAHIEEIRERKSEEPDYSQLSNEALEKIERVLREDESRRAQEGDPEEKPPPVH